MLFEIPALGNVQAAFDKRYSSRHVVGEEVGGADVGKRMGQRFLLVHLLSQRDRLLPPGDGFRRIPREHAELGLRAICHREFWRRGQRFEDAHRFRQGVFGFQIVPSVPMEPG